MNATIATETRCAGSLHRMVRRFDRRPGNGWKHLAGSVWEHPSGLRIHLLGMARLPGGQIVSWCFDDEYDAKRQQGYNVKRALMVWALSLLSPKSDCSAIQSKGERQWKSVVVTARIHFGTTHVDFNVPKTTIHQEMGVILSPVA